MGLESNTSSTYIDGLVATNPTSADNVGDGDNHIRLIKDVLKRSFSGITGEVSATHTALNLAATEISAATNAATASTVVKRDSGGNFSATVVTANLIGNVVGSVQGDVYASNGVAKVLENGTDGTDAIITADVTGDLTGTAEIASRVDIPSVSADTEYRMVFGQDLNAGGGGGSSSGSNPEYLFKDLDGSFHYNPSTNTLTAGNFSGAVALANVTGLQTALDAKTTPAAAKLAAWPIGSIYTSVNSANPSTLFGGNWEAFGAGKVLIGIDASDTDFDTVEETGGAKTHALSIAEMPAHSHTYTLENTRGAGSPGAGNGDSSFSTPNTSTVGSGAAHNNVQPYIVVYMFKRIAD
jgi:hypothetical protein